MLLTLDIRNFSDADYETALLNVSFEKALRIKSMKSFADRKRSVAGDMLCRNGISSLFGISPVDIEIFSNNYGKPYAKNLPVFFSISHSHDYVVCYINNKECGIDIEKICVHNPKIAERFFSERERDYINEIDFDKRFCEIWTLKEAFIKALGKGSLIDISNISFEIDNARILANTGDYSFTLNHSIAGYIIATALKIN